MIGTGLHNYRALSPAGQIIMGKRNQVGIQEDICIKSLKKFLLNGNILW